jgi:hypothetical protein
MTMEKTAETDFMKSSLGELIKVRQNAAAPSVNNPDCRFIPFFLKIFYSSP